MRGVWGAREPSVMIVCCWGITLRPLQFPSTLFHTADLGRLLVIFPKARL